MIEQRRFAGRSQCDETADFLAQISLGETLECVGIDLSVLERRDNRQPYSGHHAQLRMAGRARAFSIFDKTCSDVMTIPSRSFDWIKRSVSDRV